MPYINQNHICSWCNRKKDLIIAADPCWGYYCKHCYDKLNELERTCTLHLHNY